MHVGTQRTGIGEEALVRKDNGSFLNWNVSDVGSVEQTPGECQLTDGYVRRSVHHSLMYPHSMGYL